MLTETLKSISDRIESPISGTFITAWLITNWQIPITTVFGDPSRNRVELIQGYLKQSNLWCLLIIPLGFTLIYLFGMPLARELYRNFMNSVEYRISIRDLKLETDLSEIKEYKQTLKALLGNLSDHYRDNIQNLQRIHTLINDKQVSTASTELDNLIKRHEEIHKQHVYFTNTYKGEPKDQYRYLFVRRNLPTYGDSK
ncbi:hypothetical protein DOE51_10305 [Bdellovibrio sp. NC01]|nr:hypothetical protein DOE51_10305 [Bdellovibrio sp. NC01]